MSRMTSRSRNPRRGQAAIAASLLVMAVGCRSTSEVKTTEAPKVLDAASGVQGDSGVVKTDFRSEVDVKDQVGVHLDLARTHEARGDFQAAVYEYARAVEAAEKPGARGKGLSDELKGLAHRRMAAALDRVGQFAQAEVHYKSALKLQPGDPKVWNDAGYSAYLQGNLAEAERRLKSAEKLSPRDPRIQTNLGLCLAATGRTDEALAALSKPGGPAIGHANLAYILAAMGKTDEARRHYEIALKFQPELQAARLALAQLDRAGDKPATTLIANGTAPTGDAAVARVGLNAPARSTAATR